MKLPTTAYALLGLQTPQQALTRELEEEVGVIIDAPSRPGDEVLSVEADPGRCGLATPRRASRTNERG